MPRVLRNIRISECSSVDKAANPFARVLIAKRRPTTPMEAAASQRRAARNHRLAQQAGVRQASDDQWDGDDPRDRPDETTGYERRRKMVSLTSVSKGLRVALSRGDAGYGTLMNIAKMLRRPNETDAAAFTATYCGSNPRLPRGPSLLAMHLAQVNKLGGGGARSRFSPQSGDEHAADFEPDVTVSEEAGTEDMPYPESGYDALAEWNGAVSRIQRQMKLPTRSAAVDAAMRDSGARSHWERAKAHRQVPG
jgi:hypothetical protein